MSELRVFLPVVQKLELGEACVFRFRRGAEREAFVLQTPAGLVAFANECPHWHVDLDLGEGRFWDPDTERILCKNHGALFDPVSGVCERGPCVGDALEAFAVEPELDGAWVSIPNAEAAAELGGTER